MHNHSPRQERRSRRTATKSTERPLASRSGKRSTILTVVPQRLRGTLDTVVGQAFEPIHLSSFTDAPHAITAQRVHALVLAAEMADRAALPGIARLIGKHPTMLPVAVISANTTSCYEQLLSLGACGVKRVVNVAEPSGWRALRGALDEIGGNAGATIADALDAMLRSASDETRAFFSHTVRVAPSVTNVRRLAETLNVRASTLMSRFFRARLPGPKTYLSLIRILYAVSFFEEDGRAVVDVSNALEYSSPQSFGRHVRLMLGMTAADLRSSVTLQSALAHFQSRLVEPYSGNMRDFRPLPRYTSSFGGRASVRPAE